MANRHHDESQRLAAQAAALLREGSRQEALALFKQSAALEQQAYAEVPPDRVRTRGILAVSFVALLYKAREYEQAETAIYRLLSTRDLPESASVQLKDLLSTVWDEQALAVAGLKYTGDDILVALKGGEVGVGTAPIDTALQYMTGVTSLVYRLTEFESHQPFRQRGQPSSEIQEFVQARATQPASGSYRFSIKLVQPVQRWLFDEKRELQPHFVIERIMQVLRATVLDNAPPLEHVIPDRQYRNAVTKLVRNVLPNDKDLREVEVRIGGSAAQDSGVTLLSGARRKVAAQIRADNPSAPEAKPVRVEGVLRALDLDKQWLEVVESDGNHVRFKTSSEEVEDVLGPMVNRRVIASGMKRNAEHPRLIDIELSRNDAS
ncbi:MAG TPA: hypothetical protein VD837_19100 [Terriglobales bacterium]|nr:hypothetical protein [Terriglobales bacterium]